MTRAGFVQRLVLNTICDDFENVDQVILREVSEVGGKCGLTIGRSDVVEALRDLVEFGLAGAYDLSACGRDPFSGKRGLLPVSPHIDPNPASFASRLSERSQTG